MAGPLAKLIRQKYPGQYDDMSDEDLEKAVLTKFPDYADLVEPQIPVNTSPAAPSNISGGHPAKMIDVPQVDEPIESNEWKGLFDNPIWNTATRPIADIGLNPEMRAHAEEEMPIIGRGMNFMTDVISGLSSPLNIVTAGAFTGSSMLANRLPQIARSLGIIGKGLSAPVALEGGIDLANAESIPEAMIGGLELGGGILGMKSRIPQVRRNVVDEVLPESVDLNLNPEVAAPPTSKNIKWPEGKLKKRYYELADKEQAGTLTAKELDEASRLYKQLNENDINPINPDTGQFIKQPKLQLRLNSDGTYTNKATGEVIPIDTLKSEQVNIDPPKPTEKIDPSTHVKLPVVDVKRSNLQEALNFPRSIQAAYDISFPFRQGLGLIHTKGWWISWDDMVKSYGSENAFRAVQESILNKPNYIKVKDAKGNLKPSFAEEAGLALVDLTKNLSKREEAILSTWAERIPGVKASNRAYTAFANKLRSDNFDALIEQAEKMGLDPKRNLVLAKQIASYVNTASGRGSLGKSFEKNAVELAGVFFSPRLIASRLQMMNPKNYVARDSFVRKQYLKSMLVMAGAWTAFASLGKLAGAEVNMQPTNADFGKIKIGDTRFDPGGGFQQYLVLFSRLTNQGRTSSTSGKFTEYDKKFGAPTFGEDLIKFIRNKLAPVPSFMSDPFFASERFPFELGDRSLRMFAPIIVQDLSELIQEDPMLIPGIIPSAIGLGTQTYGEREPSRLFGPLFPREYDIQFPR